MTITPGTILFSDNANTTLAGAITSSATTATLVTGSGVEFPAPGAGQYFVGTLNDASTGLLFEIVHVTNVTGDVITMVRGQEGTDALNWSAGDIFFNGPTSGTMQSMAQQSQVQGGIMSYAADSGTLNALAVTLSPAPISLAALVGGPVRVKVANTTTSTTPTLAINGLTALTIINPNGSALAVGQLVAGAIAEFIYDGTNAQLQSISAPGVTSVQVAASSNGGLTFSGGPITNSGTISAAISFANLPSKAAPTSSDLVLIGNAASGNAPTETTIAELAAAGVPPQYQVIWGGTSGGSANAQTITPTPTLASVASPCLIYFTPGAGLTNTGALQINPGTGLKNVLRRTPTGPAAMVGGEVVGGSGLVYGMLFDGTEFQLLNSTPRIQLQANTTLYVATTGSDSANTGLTSGSPFATLQHAWNVLQSQYDLNGFTVTIQFADGTYTAGLSAVGLLPGQAGAPGVIIQGDTGNLNSVILAPTASQSVILARYGAQLTLQYMEIEPASGQASINATDLAEIRFQQINFAATTGSHILATSGGIASAIGNYTISGGAFAHWYNSGNSYIQVTGFTITISGTPAFSNGFATAQIAGGINCASNTFSGSATGPRYSITGQAGISTNGGGASYLPGSSSGTSAGAGSYT